MHCNLKAANGVPVDLGCLWPNLYWTCAQTGNCELPTKILTSPGVKVSRNVPERCSGARKYKTGAFQLQVIGFHSQNLRSWVQQVSNLHYINKVLIKVTLNKVIAGGL